MVTPLRVSASSGATGSDVWYLTKRSDQIVVARVKDISVTPKVVQVAAEKICAVYRFFDAQPPEPLFNLSVGLRMATFEVLEVWKWNGVPAPTLALNIGGIPLRVGDETLLFAADVATSPLEALQLAPLEQKLYRDRIREALVLQSSPALTPEDELAWRVRFIRDPETRADGLSQLVPVLSARALRLGSSRLTPGLQAQLAKALIEEPNEELFYPIIDAWDGYSDPALDCALVGLLDRHLARCDDAPEVATYEKVLRRIGVGGKPPKNEYDLLQYWSSEKERSAAWKRCPP